MKHRTAVLLSVALLGASACSGSDDETEEVETATTDADADADAEPADTATTDTATDGVEAGDPGEMDEEFCSAIVAIQTADFGIEETFGDDARALFDDVQSAAPADLADDVAVVIATLDAVAEIGIAAEENDPIAEEETLEILFDPAFTEANSNLEAYTSQACGGGVDASSSDGQGS